jgi:hypothetical protein
MQAIVGDDPAMYHTPHGFFCPKTPMASDVGLGPLEGPRDYDKVKEKLKAAGYAGEKVTMLVATDRGTRCSCNAWWTCRAFRSGSSSSRRPTAPA